jgi:hypothetical protein
MEEHIYERWLRDRNEAVQRSVRDCYEECEKMIRDGDATEEDFVAWRRRCIHALSPAPLKKHFWEFAAGTHTKDNLQYALKILSEASEHMNRPDFALPNLRINCVPDFEVPPPEVLLGLE